MQGSLPYGVDSVLARMAVIAADDQTAYWVAWADGELLAIDARYPRDPLAIRGQALLPIETPRNIRAQARWYVAQDEMIVDLGQ